MRNLQKIKKKVAIRREIVYHVAKMRRKNRLKFNKDGERLWKKSIKKRSVLRLLFFL